MAFELQDTKVSPVENKMSLMEKLGILSDAAESVLAAKLVLDGARAAGDSLYFLAPELTDDHWIMENQSYVTTIGCHWFYR